MAVPDKAASAMAIATVFDRRQTRARKLRIAFLQRDRLKAGCRVSKSDKSISSHTVRAGRDAVSSVKFSQELTAEIDAWAEAHQTTRSDAIRLLVELGLNAAPRAHRTSGDQDPLAIEALAVRQIVALLDPQLPADERERRIRRLVDGPPEFFGERIDLPRREK
jgi:hypothetical protein